MNDQALSTSPSTAIVEDATAYALDLCAAEKERLERNSDFLTWLVGLGAAAFLVFVSKTPAGPIAPTSLPDALAWFVGVSYVAVLGAAVAYRALLAPLIEEMAIERMLYSFQLGAFKASPALLTSRVEDAASPAAWVAAVIEKAGLPDAQFNHWYKNRVLSKRREALVNALYVVAVIGFLGEIGTLVALVLRLLSFAA